MRSGLLHRRRHEAAVTVVDVAVIFVFFLFLLPALPRASSCTAYPMGLPEYDIIRVIIEDAEEIAGTAASQDHLDPDSAELWWAGKEFLRDKVPSSIAVLLSHCCPASALLLPPMKRHQICCDFNRPRCSYLL